MLHSAATVVVGVDGSKAATDAARWAVDEAVGRDIPLRLVYVIEPSDPVGAEVETGGHAAARSALRDAQRAVEATGKPVKIETEILTGKPLVALMEESRAAAMICVGALGLNHAHHGVGSLAAAVAASALCPVAVIRRAPGRPAHRQVSRVVVEADNAALLRFAFDEARLRRAPLCAISVSATAGPDNTDGRRLAQAELRRRIAPWEHLYPDVPVESGVVRGTVDKYLAAAEEPDQLFVTDSRACRQLCGTPNAKHSVLALRFGNL
ncbi:universal stress protein [Mycobacterium sp. HUMS_1102779]|uniref:universal stress protein n=1 Tax=Mycobacterium sp. HUMS_1102779 TaxID=3383487 RepID=UPI00389B19E8